MAKGWKWYGSNLNEMSKQEKREFSKKMFKWTLALDRMKTNKPKLNDKEKKDIKKENVTAEY